MRACTFSSVNLSVGRTVSLASAAVEEELPAPEVPAPEVVAEASDLLRCIASANWRSSNSEAEASMASSSLELRLLNLEKTKTAFLVAYAAFPNLSPHTW
jgi:hypothetical protein